MNSGGFSWKRLVGISAFKSRVSRKIGIPLTAGGRRRKLGAALFNAFGPVAGTLAVATVAVTKQREDSSGSDEARSSNARGQSLSLDQIWALQAEAKETAKKEGWQSTCIYFENAERGLYQVVLAENTDHIRQTLQEGLNRVGFIGMKDAPKGIQFGFTLDDSFPVDGIVAKRFLVNAREWAVTRSKNLCTEKGIAAPVVHEMKFSKQFLNAQSEGSAQNVAPAKHGVTPFALGAVLGITGLVLGAITGEWRMTLVILLFTGFFFVGRQGRATRMVIALIISCLIFQAWWAAGVVTAATVAAYVWRNTRGDQHGA
jgi:hypothetical protein